MSRDPLQLSYCDQYHFELPPGHKFPLEKYRLLRESLTPDSRFELRTPTLACIRDLLRVHTHDYVRRFLDGSLDPKVMRRIGFPWSEGLVTRTLASVGGTLLATQAALQTGFGGTLAGGTHHAFRDEGAGFCVFNDLAIAIEWARAEAGIRRVAVIDLDVHQGDGTASLYPGGNEAVFTLSLHGSRNFPFRKQTSSLDVELPDGSGDEFYLNALQQALDKVWTFNPDLLLFQSGVDGLESDRLGRLALSLEGLQRRDTLVIGAARQRRLPLVITLGGGYSEPIDKTVAAHAQTFRTAADIYF